MRILLVDDHEDSRELLAIWLEAAGHVVLAAANLAEARKIMHEAQPLEILLTDLHLPDGDGTELAREMRREYPVVKCIAATGDTRTQHDDFDAVFTKPLDLERLKTLLTNPT